VVRVPSQIELSSFRGRAEEDSLIQKGCRGAKTVIPEKFSSSRESREEVELFLQEVAVSLRRQFDLAEQEEDSIARGWNCFPEGWRILSRAGAVSRR